MATLRRYLKKHLKVTGRHAKNHFIAHRGNGHHPHVLKHHVLLGYGVILVLLKVIAVIGPIALPSSSLYSSSITPKNIIDLTNQTRENLDLPKLNENDRLTAAAAAKAEDMLINQYFAHTSPSGVTPWDWIRNAGYVYSFSGENLAVHFYEAEDVEAGWLASASHRANIVNKNYTEIGVGASRGVFEGVETIFVVQMFGSPATSVPAVVSQQSASRETSRAVTAAVSSQKSDEVAEAELSESQNQPQKIVVTPYINEAGAKIAERGGAYKLKLDIDNATSAVASLGNEQVELKRAGTSNSWLGEIGGDSKAIASTGEYLTVMAANDDSAPVTKSIALAAPTSTLQQLYVFNEGTDKYIKFFGFLKIGNLDDQVRKFYVVFIILLGAALFLNVLVMKFRQKRYATVKNSLAIMVLALFLLTV